jgi:tRNA(fMet)-specific endonuclease VapC
MNYLLDTNTCIAILRDKPESTRRRAERAVSDGSHLSISSIVVYELWYGCFKSSRFAETSWRLRTFLAGDIDVLKFDEEDARIAGELRAKLESAGQQIGAYDTLIGGQCLRHGMTLVTNNMSEFSRIQGLKSVDWIG